MCDRFFQSLDIRLSPAVSQRTIVRVGSASGFAARPRDAAPSRTQLCAGAVLGASADPRVRASHMRPAQNPRSREDVRRRFRTSATSKGGPVAQVREKYSRFRKTPAGGKNFQTNPAHVRRAFRPAVAHVRKTRPPAAPRQASMPRRSWVRARRRLGRAFSAVIAPRRRPNAPNDPPLSVPRAGSDVSAAPPTNTNCRILPFCDASAQCVGTEAAQGSRAARRVTWHRAGADPWPFRHRSVPGARPAGRVARS